VSTGIRILYIEDDPGLSRLVRAKLEAEGYRVEICATGREGLAAFDEALHDLVIIDYQLPDYNGLQVLESLVARGAAIPVIIATGAGSEEIAVRAMKLGAADYINKESYGKFFHLLPSLIEKTMRQHELARQKQRAETESRESEERLRSILASIDDAVLVTDKAGLFVAARASGDHGRPSAASPDWIGATFRDVGGEDVACAFEASFAAVQANNRVEQFDYSLSMEGSEVWFNAKVSPLKDMHSGFAGVTIVARDVTVRKQAEEQLRLASLAANAASRAKTELLAGMSHELRTPLTAIIGYAEILFYEYFGTVNERQKQQLDVILQCSRHLLDLINDILDIAKIESGKTDLDLSAVRIGSLISHTVVLLKETAARRKIRVQVTVPPELASLEISADERRIKQVLFNLLSNALKFTSEGGEIEISLWMREGLLAVSVTDTGIGIPATELEKIFEAFYQIKGRPSTSRAPGSGLGLSLARQIVDLHGGRIWAESEGEGTGSRFVFTLPMNRPPGAQPLPTNQTGRPPGAQSLPTNQTGRPPGAQKENGAAH
jgi:signal transduction histidine kinase/FixJ family two-component response regulator